ncbi:MAG: adenylyltransferase/cytidyltransferase family protein [Endozoicomonadaceae bacterium]|nr:adenylyltransferase/cytidyltransferase family protein [Endozoicomonadaceae bacterium]
MLKKIGVFGSAFDPPTLGHQNVIMQARNLYDELILIPSICHPFKKKMSSFEKRCEWVQKFIEDISPCIQKPVSLSCIEKILWSGYHEDTVFTYTVLEALEQRYYPKKNYQLIFIRGEDNAQPAIWSTFYRAEDIVKKWPIFTAKIQKNIRSSTVRSMICRKQPISSYQAALTELLSPHVLSSVLKTFDQEESL